MTGADAALDLIERLIRERMAVLHRQGREEKREYQRRAAHLRADELGLLVRELRRAREVADVA